MARGLRTIGLVVALGGMLLAAPTTAGEILALGNQGSATVRGTMSNWLNSDQHHSILLDPRFDEIGLGLVHGGFRGYAGVSFWVGHFGYHG